MRPGVLDQPGDFGRRRPPGVRQLSGRANWRPPAAQPGNRRARPVINRAIFGVQQRRRDPLPTRRRDLARLVQLVIGCRLGHLAFTRLEQRTPMIGQQDRELELAADGVPTRRIAVINPKHHGQHDRDHGRLRPGRRGSHDRGGGDHQCAWTGLDREPLRRAHVGGPQAGGRLLPAGGRVGPADQHPVGVRAAAAEGVHRVRSLRGRAHDHRRCRRGRTRRCGAVEPARGAVRGAGAGRRARRRLAGTLRQPEAAYRKGTVRPTGVADSVATTGSGCPATIW